MTLPYPGLLARCGFGGDFRRRFFRDRRHRRNGLLDLDALRFGLRNRSDHNPHIASFHTRISLALSESVAGEHNTVQNFSPLVEEGHFAAPEENGNLDTMPVFKKVLDRLDLEGWRRTIQRPDH